jgi:hypothetical protein
VEPSRARQIVPGQMQQVVNTLAERDGRRCLNGVSIRRALHDREIAGQRLGQKTETRRNKLQGSANAAPHSCLPPAFVASPLTSRRSGTVAAARVISRTAADIPSLGADNAIRLRLFPPSGRREGWH